MPLQPESRAKEAVAKLCQGDTDIGDLRRYGRYAAGISRILQAVMDYQRMRP